LRLYRTRRETKYIEKAKKYGIRTPNILKKNKYSIEMEYIDGKKIRDILDRKNMKKFAKEISEIVSKLHQIDIIHNDLTTSNMIYKDGIYLIDFGLSESSHKLEKKAMDLYVLKKALVSTHHEIADEMWKIIEHDYENKKVLNQLKKIEQRGRYKTKQ
jgi:Kae1-associated kinase Bud32